MTETSSPEICKISDSYFSDELILKLVDKFKNNQLKKAIIINFNGSKDLNFIYNLCYLCLKSKLNQQEDIQKLDYLFQNNLFHDLKILSSNDIIKIDQIRELIEFIQFNPVHFGFKFCIIDPIENCNINSMNAILKSLEDERENIFYFFSSNGKKKILKTIESRMLTFSIRNEDKLKEEMEENLFSDLINKINSKRHISQTLINFIKTNKKNYPEIFLKQKLIFAISRIVEKCLKIENDENKIRIIMSFEKLKSELSDNSLSLVNFLNFSNQILKYISIKL